MASDAVQKHRVAHRGVLGTLRTGCGFLVWAAVTTSLCWGIIHLRSPVQTQLWSTRRAGPNDVVHTWASNLLLRSRAEKAPVDWTDSRNEEMMEPAVTLNPDDLFHGSPYLEAMRGAPNLRALYLDIVLHKGFTNQVFALLNGLAIAHLLNITLVLPEMSTNYDYHMYAGADIQKMEYEDSPTFRVPMSEIFDTEALRAAVSPWVRVVDALPEHLQGTTMFSRMPAHLVNPKRPETLWPYLGAMQDALVLRIKCPLSSLVWNTPQIGELRKAAIAALAPGRAVSTVLASRLQSIRAPSGLSAAAGYISLHLRVEEDWIDHCKKEPENPAKTQIESFEQCWAGGGTVAERLDRVVSKVESSQGVRLPRLLYVATGQTDQDYGPFYARGFTVLSPANFSSNDLMAEDGQVKRDLAAVVDYFIMRGGVLFVGNIFSSFSFSIRENYLYSRIPDASSVKCFYYNDPDPAPLLDITPTEALRWRVMAGIAYPELYISPGKEGFLTTVCHVSSESQCAPPQVTSLVIKSVQESDDGFVSVSGWVTSTGLPWIHILAVYDLPVGTFYILANEPLYKLSPRTHNFEFSFDGKGLKNRFMVCAAEGGRRSPTCTTHQVIASRAPLKRPERMPPGMGGGTVYIYSGHGQKFGGGTESLHKLNAVINSEFAKGSIALNSILQNGNENYRMADSVFVDDLTSRDVGVNDVFVVPEGLHSLQPAWHYVFDETGAIPMQYFLGQHTIKLRVDRAGKEGFQPLCLLQYFSDLHGCPPKALLTSSLNDSWIAAGRGFRRVPGHKENIILVDEDSLLHFNPLLIQVPGAEVIVLRGLTPKEVMSYYKRAKINLDSYITGRERALFEGALFNVIPVVKDHAAATDSKVFAIPPEWRWDNWDYNKLNQQLTELLNSYDSSLGKLKPLIDEVESWVDSFPKQVSAFFGDNIHIVLSAIGDTCDLDLERRTVAMVSAVVVMLQYPFATVELLVHNRYYMEYDFAGLTDLLFQRGMHRRLTFTQLRPEYQRLCSSAILLQPPAAKQRKRHALLVPRGSLPFDPDLVTSLLAAEPAMGCNRSSLTDRCKFPALTISGGGGVLLVDQGSYYNAVTEALPLATTTSPGRPLLERLSVGVKEVPMAELGFFSRKYSHSSCAGYPLCSGTLQLEPWDGDRLAAMSPECLQICVCGSLTPILGMLLRMLPDSQVVRNLHDLSNMCSSGAAPA